jgi:hypothetical protein
MIARIPRQRMLTGMVMDLQIKLQPLGSTAAEIG